MCLLGRVEHRLDITLEWRHYGFDSVSNHQPHDCLLNVYSNADQSKHQSKHQRSASLAFLRGIHRGPVNSPHKWPVTRNMFPFEDVIMNSQIRPMHENGHRGRDKVHMVQVQSKFIYLVFWSNTIIAIFIKRRHTYGTLLYFECNCAHIDVYIFV